MKGISPLIATVLLIAFTVAVGGILSVWLTTFSRTSTDIIGSQSSTQLTCSYGGISLSNLAETGGWVSGNVRNTGLIGLGNFTFVYIWSNATSFSTQLCSNSSSAFSCTTSNMSFTTNQVLPFNVSAGGGTNVQTLRVATNCTNAFATASSSDFTSIT